MTTERRPRGRPPHPDILTPREWQVLDLLREGLSNEQIAQRLDVSLATAKYHVSEILTKLGLTSREEAAAWHPLPESAIRWWQRAFAWVPRRAWPLAGAVVAVAAIAALAWIVFGASGGEDGNTAASLPSDSPSATETAAATPAPLDVSFPPLSIPNPQDTKVFFIRGAPGYFEPGALWMSNLDGTREEVLVAEPVVQRVIGVVNHWQTGNATVYYINTEMTAEYSETTPRAFGRQTVSSLDLVTRERTLLLSYETWSTPGENADVTADGRLLAYADRAGLAIYDLANGEKLPLFEADPPELCFGDIPPAERRCKEYARPTWSPDGRFLVYYAGSFGYPQMLDTVDGTVSPISSEANLTRSEEWASSTPSICLIDSPDFDQVTGIMVASAPDWQATTTFLGDFHPNLAAGVPNWLPLRCVWVDDVRVAVLYYGQTHYDQTDPRNRFNEVLIIDTRSGDVRKLQEHRFLFGDRDILTVAGRNFLISGPGAEKVPDPLGESFTPEVVDIETNARHPILTAEDWVVAAVPAESIEP
jgi:DNA-binding CsgD family transcriptional regulator